MTSFFAKARVIFIVVCIILLGALLWFKTSELQELRADYDQCKRDLANAKAEIEGLKTTVSFKEKETADINELLGECYKKVVQHQKDWDDIDRIMDLKDEEESCKKEEDSDACISRKAGEAGLDFLNRQFDSVR